LGDDPGTDVGRSEYRGRLDVRTRPERAVEDLRRGRPILLCSHHQRGSLPREIVSPHSNRSASVGLTEAARQAGSMAAANATPASVRLAAAIVGASRAWTPNSCATTRRRT